MVAYTRKEADMIDGANFYILKYIVIIIDETPCIYKV